MAVRKRASKTTKKQWERFTNAITSLIADGTYGQLVSIHAEMMHNMHGGMGATGRQRFLPWHRVYLLRLEEAMQAIEPKSFIPYWDWTRQRTIPAKLANFMPTVAVPGQGTVSVSRNIGWPPLLPTKAVVDDVMDESTFWDFVTGLEIAHNGVHGWVGGSMALLTTAPADPIFWLHHAQIDRLWSMWQASNPALNPALAGNDRVLDPWPEREDQVRSVAALGYSYGP